MLRYRYLLNGFRRNDLPLLTGLALRTLSSRPHAMNARKTNDMERTTTNPKTDRRQCTNTVLMIRSSCFNFNPVTAADNSFQKQSGLSPAEIKEGSLREFDDFVSQLRSARVNVNVEEDTLKKSADAIFPNNWISFHQERKIVVYPMKVENRRLEKRYDLVKSWKEKLGAEVIDYSHYEQKEKFLEGTGSMVLDRVNQIVYSCKSLRTNVEMLDVFCTDLGYTPVVFTASLMVNSQPIPIYHTNVMLSIGDTFAIVCVDAIRDEAEKALVLDSLQKTRTVVQISEEQVNSLAGNVIQLHSSDEKKLLVMSTGAFKSLTASQLATIRQHCDDIVHSPLEIIEALGGGGARCMIAEIFP